MSRQAAIDAMTLRLMRTKGMSLEEATELATELGEDIPEAPAAPTVVTGGAERRIIESGDAIRVRAVPGRAGVLDAAQQAALQRGIQLCPNCQQPVTAHIPGCAREEYGGLPAMDRRAVTKDPLPPVG